MSEMPESFQEAPRESSAQTGATAKAKVRDDRRVRWLVAAAVLFAASTFLALSQSPWPYPYDPPRTFTADWWLHPIERNPERRLPLISREINGVWMSANHQRIWAVGDDGLVLLSEDGGKSWQQLEISRTAGSKEDGTGAFWSWPGGEAEAEPQSVPSDFQDLGSTQPISSRPPNQEQQLAPPAPAANLSPLPDSEFEALMIAWQDVSDFELMAEAPPVDLHSVWFRDDLHGWVGGSGGFLMRTTDGGNTWESRRLPKLLSSPTVVSLAFPKPELGCLIIIERDGNISALAVSHDDGDHWQILAETDSERLFTLDGECLAVGGGQVLSVNAGTDSSEDVERRQLTFALTKSLADRGVSFTVTDARDSANLYAGGGRKRFSETARSSQPRASRDLTVGHRSLHFFGPKRGVATTWRADGVGRIQLTDDGGRTWRAVEELALEPQSVEFVEPGFGWAVDQLGRLFLSFDGGETWSVAGRVPATTGRTTVVFADFDKGISLDGVAASTSQNGGNSWRRAPDLSGLPSGVEVLDLTQPQVERPIFEGMVDNIAVTVLGDDGHIYKLRTTTPLFPAVSLLRAELMVDRRYAGAREIAHIDDHLWVGGLNGLHLIDQASQSQEQITDRPVLSFHFLDRQTGWIAEPGGGLLFTEDGGATWTDLTPYRIYPAPWYWLACCVSLLLLTPAFRRPPTQEVHRSVAEMAVSDRPIEAGDPDPLDFGQVALGLSRFLRNSATQPPLTLAVTGKWGTGKSSLMNLLRADLEHYSFRPVWFNAWHHQKEEQLLAALLINIRRQAIPSMFSPEGWAFRGRLLAHRMRRWWLLTLFFTLGFGLLTGWVATSSTGAGLMTRVWETLEKLNPAAWLAPNGETVEPGMAAFLVAAAAVLFTLHRGLRAFGVDPGTLVAGLSSRASRRDASAQAGFRHRFAREFEDVTRALRPRTLTLLIDDLDRCRPQNVLDVLEAVNFLVSSGRCYVVLGIDREMVERFVGYGFREVADEILARDEAAAEEGDDEAAARARRAAFARQYLEKLINIEVTVPRVEEAGGRDLVRPPEPKAERPGRWRRFAGWLRSLPGRWWALPAVLAMTLIAGLLLGSWFGKEPPVVAETPPEEAVTVEPQVEPEVPDEATVLDEETAAPETPDEEQIATGPPARLIPGEEGDRHHSWFWLAVVVLLTGATIWVLTTLPQVEVHDSPEFVEALDAWFPLLHAETPTPRSIKRFLNRVRCYAMRQRPAEPPRTRSGAMGDWLGGLVGKPLKKSGKLTEDSGQIPERALVALAAVEHVYPHLLRDPDFWMDPWERQVTVDQEGHSLSIAEIVGSDLPEIHSYRRAFAGLSRGIETH